ncbi:MAG: hypothetical protein K1X71_03995 [Pirellulales bacterium]|nr:hypothetical protein [Pirellulales bacterium]
MNADCLNESDLLALASDDVAPAELRAHVDQCSDCQRALAALKAEVSTLRLVLPAGRPVATSGSGAGRPAFIGRYFIAGVLRDDDWHIVYRGAHAVLFQEVSVALSKAQFDDDPKLLSQAARALVQFNHPAVERVLDFDFFGRQPFVVEAFVPATMQGELKNENRNQRTCAQYILHYADAALAIEAAGLSPLDWALVEPVFVAGQLRLTRLGETWLRPRIAPDLPTNTPLATIQQFARLQAASPKLIAVVDAAQDLAELRRRLARFTRPFPRNLLP